MESKGKWQRIFSSMFKIHAYEYKIGEMLVFGTLRPLYRQAS